MPNLNEIKIAEWKNNPNIAVEIAKVIESASWKRSPFQHFIGKGENRGIRAYKTTNASPYRPRLKAPLSGDGVVGNADFDTNIDRLEILSQTIYPRVIGNSMKSQIQKYDTMEQISFIKEATDSLTEWECKKRDRALFAALVNNMTNAVVCDATAGYKDISSDADVTTATKKITAGDICNVKAIRKAIAMAKTGKDYKGNDIYPIKPTHSTLYTEAGISVEQHSYIIMLSTYAIEQLRNDPDWIELQKVNVRGLKNNLFTGLAGVIDDCPVIDMGVWSSVTAGMPDSTISDSEFKSHLIGENTDHIVTPAEYANSQAVCIGALIGASALVMAGDSQPTFYIDDTADIGRKTQVGIDRLYAIAKAKLSNDDDSGVLKNFNNKDYGVIGIFSSKE